MTPTIRALRPKARAAHTAQVEQMIDRRVDDPSVKSGHPCNVGSGRGARLDRSKHGADAAAHSRDPIWKMATATTHATLSCRATQKAVQRMPISRRCAASVATHGV